MPSTRGPWIDVHAHPGRCFLAGMDEGDLLPQLLGGDGSTAALAAARSAGLAAVSFATVADLLVLAPTESGGLHAGRPFEPGEAYADHQRQLSGLRRLLEATHAPLARTAHDIERAHAADETAVLITCEGGDFLEGDAARVEGAYAQGMSSLTFVHYRINEIGDIQTEPEHHGGLTAFGREVVAECNRLGVVIDAAHATYATVRGVLDASDAPVMISHSHLDHADRSHPRLLSDDHARAVTDAGGLIGAWPSGVISETLGDFVDEIARLIDLVGIEHVAIGTDLDANYKPVVSTHAQLVEVASRLGGRGLGVSEVDRVLGGNVVELYRVVAG